MVRKQKKEKIRSQNINRIVSWIQNKYEGNNQRPIFFKARTISKDLQDINPRYIGKIISDRLSKQDPLLHQWSRNNAHGTRWVYGKTREEMLE